MPTNIETKELQRLLARELDVISQNIANADSSRSIVTMSRQSTGVHIDEDIEAEAGHMRAMQVQMQASIHMSIVRSSSDLLTMIRSESSQTEENLPFTPYPSLEESVEEGNIEPEHTYVSSPFPDGERMLGPIRSQTERGPENENNLIITFESQIWNGYRRNALVVQMPFLQLEEDLSEYIYNPVRIEINFNIDDFFCIKDKEGNKLSDNDVSVLEIRSKKVLNLISCHYKDSNERSEIIEKILRILDAVKQNKIQINVDYEDPDICVDFLSLVIFHKYTELIPKLLDMHAHVDKNHVQLAKSKEILPEMILMLESHLLDDDSNKSVEISGDIADLHK